MGRSLRGPPMDSSLLPLEMPSLSKCVFTSFLFLLLIFSRTRPSATGSLSTKRVISKLTHNLHSQEMIRQSAQNIPTSLYKIIPTAFTGSLLYKIDYQDGGTAILFQFSYQFSSLIKITRGTRILGQVCAASSQPTDKMVLKRIREQLTAEKKYSP